MAAALNVVVTNENDSGAGSLRAAISATNSSADPANNISFANNLEGKLTLSSDLSITRPVSIDFRTSSQVILRGNVGIGIGTSGNVTLNVSHDYTGNTTLTAGTLTVGGASHGLNFGQFGSTNSLLVMSPGTTLILPGGDTQANFQNISGAGTIVNNGFNNGLALFGNTSPATQTFSGTISGSGALTMFGGRETLILSGSTTYSGPTSIFGDLDTFFAPSKPFAELRAGATNAFSPNSNFLLSGNATLNLNNFNQTIGSLSGLGANNVLLGSATLTTGGTNSDSGFAGAISGTGGIIKVGTGKFTLNGTNTYSGGTVISAGTLQLGFGGTTGSIVGNVTDNANFAINRSDAFTFSGVISGIGAFQQVGTGTTTLTAIESYGGLTTIAAGRLALSGPGNIASSSGVLADGAFDISGVSGAGTSIRNLSGSGSVALGLKTLTLTNASGDFAGTIDGTGGFTLAAGKETLSGLNTYTGATNVNAGTLSVNGSIASSSLTTVNAGGTLGGNGTVGNTTINGGTLAPGNSIGALAVQGNLAFTAAASYMVEVSPANADRTNVTGTATLGGATVKASFAAGTYVDKQYTIINAAGGVNGTFNSLANTDLPANFKSSLSYDSNNVYLNLALNFVPPPGGLNANQQSAGNAIVGFFNSNGSIPLVFGGLTPAGLTQISGEVATGTQQTTFDAMSMFMGLLSDPFIAGRSDPVTSSAGAPQFADEAEANARAWNGEPRNKSERDAYAAVYRKAPVLADPFVQHWSVWAAGYGGSQTTDGNAVVGSNNTRSSIGGVAVGADYRLSPFTLAGFAIAGGATNFSVNGLGSGRSDLFQAGAFVRHNVGAAYLIGALAYGWQDITTDRTVTIAGADLLRARFNANAFSGRLEGGYRYLVPWIGGVGITPYAAGQFVTFDLPAYAEQAIAGASTFALSYADKSVTDTRSELGLRTDKSFAMPNGIFTLRGRAAWAHDFNTDRSIVPTFQTLPGASFVVNGAAPAHDTALVTASAEMKWPNGVSLAATFEGEFSNVTRSYAGKGVARYTW
jgi:autotransporter-associated beta strand protein